MLVRLASLSLLSALWLSLGPAGARAQTEHRHEQHAPAAAAAKPEDYEGLDVPDVTVRDQDGREIRFYSDLVKGKIVAINFIFTTCTTICPPLGATFAKLQRSIDPGQASEVRLISISVDPAVDTPERLKAWSRKFGAPPGWTLVTGDKAELDRLLRALGGYAARKEDHTPTVLIGDETRNRWTRTYGVAQTARLNEIIRSLFLNRERRETR
ncbi:MAG TPA: SCO family protein [Blastocatellia bacterium]|nr:SCO family protein [Blastocatellia bacterium]